ncbi:MULTISPECIES: hypothetical protein [unclassified Mesorhizobium]|uniref:hypothetical protein n=1 Tax=unclassified Mesorhizobium TaxID=325217 RepID=UPI000FCC0CB5|nr:MULTISPECIES: hypothetical protein [unclassified Mesorhizobium]RUX90787.1 hypothetical protein EN993_29350 [Mesorhizobium sp. M7D.F.Ca.US.004.01.2.1]RVA26221.1 hypothetical protein EN935_22730 [Mesorhizobium sp. M7D.F.Ca.US.004.03.1.1]
MMRILLAVAALLAARFASAAEELPFPDLDTEGYCTALVSKMLVKAEQQSEKEKCLVDEKGMRVALQPFWHLVGDVQATYLRDNYIKEVRLQTYITVSHFVATGVGKACLEDRIFCAPDKTTVELVAFKKAGYCPSKDCIREETARRLRLEKYWSSLPIHKTGWCLSHALHQKYPPLQILSNCVAEDIGAQCLSGTRQCRPG